MINPELKPGDTVYIIRMSDIGPVPIGTKGKVLKIVEIFGEKQYDVKWENGSYLSIIPKDDIWTKKPLKKQLKEEKLSKFLINNKELLQNFNMEFFHKYLLIIRKSGIVNMLGSAPYLYMGKERIKHEFKYRNIQDEESFKEVLENADKSQAYMIDGVLKYLNKNDMEESLENVNKYLRRFSSLIVDFYILV